MLKKFFSEVVIVAVFVLPGFQTAVAEKDPCAINQRKLVKAQGVVDRLTIRKDQLQSKRDKQSAKWERGQENKRARTLAARTKNYARYSPDCFDSSTPPTVTETPAPTDDVSSRCAGARNKEAKLFAKQTKNEESQFPDAKFDKKLERLISKTERAQSKVDELQAYLDNNCGG